MFEQVFDRLIPKDALTAGAAAVIAQQLDPMVSALRTELLRRVTGEPPATFARRLHEGGWPELDEHNARTIWRAIILALAEEPAEFSLTIADVA